MKTKLSLLAATLLFAACGVNTPQESAEGADAKPRKDDMIKYVE